MNQETWLMIQVVFWAVSLACCFFVCIMSVYLPIVLVPILDKHFQPFLKDMLNMSLFTDRMVRGQKYSFLVVSPRFAYFYPKLYAKVLKVNPRSLVTPMTYVLCLLNTCYLFVFLIISIVYCVIEYWPLFLIF